VFNIQWLVKLTCPTAVEERRGFLHWISANDFEDDHDTIFAKRYPGTGTWLIQRIEFRQWFDGQKSALLWCFGKRKF
jgi:hypothetical protein